MSVPLPHASPALYQFTATSSQQLHPSGLRTWLVTITVTINGQECQLDQALLSHEVTSARPELQVTYLGQSDLYRAIYAIQELREINLLLDPAITILVAPLYHQTASSMYKLDTRLAKLVGREYLAHPKYALTIVHAHARAHDLYFDKIIICDDTLQQIFGCSEIKLHNIWRRLSRLMKKTEQKTLSLTHQLSDFNKPSSVEAEITVDEDGNIFPGDWIVHSNVSKQVVRTQSLCHRVAKKKSFKRNNSVDI